jgi:hypothetical protein
MSVIRGKPTNPGTMCRRLVMLAVVAFALWPAPAAEAAPPTVDSLALWNESGIKASWTLPAGMKNYSIEIARSPHTHTSGDNKGSFLSENWAQYAILLGHEQTVFFSRDLPGGLYHVHVSAYDATTCTSALAIGCAKEWSEVVTITVPAVRPVISEVSQSSKRIIAHWYGGSLMASDFIEIATSPDVYPDGPLQGLFLDEHMVWYDDSLSPHQGRYETSALPGGTYYVHVGTYAPETCPTLDAPLCTKAISRIRSIAIPAFPPRITYADQVDGHVALDWSLGSSGDQLVEVATSPETYPGGTLRGFFLDQNTVLFDDILGFGDQTYDAADALPPGTYYAHIGARMSCLPPAYRVCLYEFSSPPAEIVVPGVDPPAPAPIPDQPKALSALRGAPAFRSLRVARRQSVRRVAIRAVLEEQGTLTANGTVKVPGASRALRFRTEFAKAKAGKPVRLVLRLSPKGLRAARKVIRRHLTPIARITITARNEAGSRRVEKRTVRLGR